MLTKLELYLSLSDPAEEFCILIPLQSGLSFLEELDSRI
jgi:hypothetical protein